MAGVVNIITRENTNYKTYTNLNSYVESVGSYNFDGNTSLRYGDHIFQFPEAGTSFGYSEFDTSRSKQWKPKRQYFMDANYLFDREKLKLKYFFFLF